jgi:hypothetical protein
MTDTTTNPRLFSRDPAERRAFLSEVGEGIAYFIPPELRSRFQFLAEMTPSATVERAGQASQRMFDADRTAMERVGDFGTMLSEMAGVAAPFAVAPRAAMPAAEAAQEAFLGFSVPARAAAETAFERLNQPGPMPEVLYSNPPFDHAAFIRRHFGPERKAAADAQRLREDLDANDQLRAERGLPPLNPPPRPADPATLLAEFSAAREAMLGASRDMSFEELTELSSRSAAARDAAVAALSDAPSVPLFHRDGRAVVVGPGMGPGEEGKFRISYLTAERKRQPNNHVVYETKEEALSDALRGGFDLPTADPAAPVPEDFGFYQDNPALKMSSGVEWLENKQRVADETYEQRRGITGSTTATLGSGDKDMFLPTDFMRRIPGLLDERRVPGEVQYDALLRDVRERGFLPDQDGNRIVLGINHRGEPFIIEGNTRTAVASDLGIPNVRVEVRYKNGGEMVEGPFAPENIARIAARGPSGSRPENFAQGGAVMMRSGMPEQIHQGLGSLSEVARRMFMGGEVSGHPLDQYGQYLTQTYAAPIQQSASQAVSQFVDSVRQKERDYFGGGGMGAGMGGGMGSPLQGGLMGSPMQPGGMAASPFGNNVNPHSPGMSRGDFFAPPSTDSALGRLSATNATAAFAGRGPIPNIAAPMDPRANYVTADALRSGSVFAPEHRRLV